MAFSIERWSIISWLKHVLIGLNLAVCTRHRPLVERQLVKWLEVLAQLLLLLGLLLLVFGPLLTRLLLRALLLNELLLPA